MILCDYCGEPATRRVHVDHLADESWVALTVGSQYNDFDVVADHYRLLATSRYACPDHLQSAFEHVVTRVGPAVHVVLDPEL